jgi:hypothetical protein
MAIAWAEQAKRSRWPSRSTTLAAPVASVTMRAESKYRWRIEEGFQAVKGLAALDEHQVRTWTSWHRWTILAMLAHAFLAVLTAAERAHDTVVHKLIPLTCNEIRHLFVFLIDHARRDIGHLLRWSRWRRQHQAQARACHYHRREATTP